jgi:hypothetical protein
MGKVMLVEGAFVGELWDDEKRAMEVFPAIKRNLVCTHTFQ